MASTLLDSFFHIDTAATMKGLLESDGEKQLQVGDIVEGTIVQIQNEEVRVDISAKSEGVIPLDEIKDINTGKLEYQVGDKILVYVLWTETKEGKVLLSYSKAQVEKLWFDLEELNRNNHSLDVKIIEVNRGGVIGLYEGKVRGFIPLSQLSVHHRPKIKRGEERDNSITVQLEKLLGSVFSVRIIEVDPKQNRLILSERAAEVQNPNLINELSIGQHIEGKVSNILKFGLFIDLGGFDGFVHISEVSWNRIKPEELYTMYKIGQKIEVVVIDIDQGSKRVSLSIKQLQQNPWIALASKYYVGQILKGRITALADFGLFVELEKNFEGLLHISDIKLERDQKIADVYQDGQEIEIKILNIDTDKKRLGLGFKDTQASGPGKIVRKDDKKDDKKDDAKGEKEEDKKTENKDQKSEQSDTSAETTSDVKTINNKPSPETAESPEKKSSTPETPPKPADSDQDATVDQSPEHKQDSEVTEDKSEVVKRFASLEGVGNTIAERLYDAGYRTLDDIVKAGTSELTLVPGIRRSLAEKIIEHAQ